MKLYELLDAFLAGFKRGPRAFAGEWREIGQRLKRFLRR
jgi:hypothetical protein